MHKALIALLFLLAVSGAVRAKDAAPAAEDPVLEQRVLALTLELRCLVCQNQTIAESLAPLAVDLKNQVREQLRNGASDAEVVKYMVDRYGDFVLYRPPVKATTWLLWFGPFVLLAGAIAFLLIQLARRRKLQQADDTLDENDRARAQQVINAGAGNE